MCAVSPPPDRTGRPPSVGAPGRTRRHRWSAVRPQPPSIRAALAQKGLKAYTADIRRRLAANAGGLSAQDVRELCGAADLAGVGLEGLLGSNGRSSPASPASRRPTRCSGTRNGMRRSGNTSAARARAGDPVAADGTGFYADVLRRHHALVAQTRRAFERLRPESLERLGQWVDGDEFDTRKLIDLAVDRRTGEPLRAHLHEAREGPA